jgi:tetratricopeptide (TPR) repeat protein
VKGNLTAIKLYPDVPELNIYLFPSYFHRVRARAKERHVYAKRLEAAIIIQRNLAPKARANNLARLAMVTMRTYAHIADDVVSFIESFLLEGGINSAVDIFTEQISSKFEVVHPKVEERILDSMIFDAVVVEMHIWLEEQMLAILAENHRISEEKKKHMEMYQGRPEQSLTEITWHNLPMEYYMMENFESPNAHAPFQNPTVIAASNALFSQSVSAAASRIASPNVGQQAMPPEARDVVTLPSPVPPTPMIEPEPISAVTGLIPPSVQHRSNFLRGSMPASISIQHSPIRSSITASFSISPQHYRSVMNRLSSIDMAHSMKYQAALAAANLAADLSSSASERDETSPKPLSRMTSFMGSNSCFSEDGADAVPPGMARLPSVRFIDNDVVQSPELSVRADDMLPKAQEGALLEKLCVQGIAEGDFEDDEEGTSEKALPTQSSFADSGSKAPVFEEEEKEEEEEEEEAAAVATSETEGTAPDGEATQVTDIQENVTASESLYTSQPESSRQAFADFAEAFASMSITSVLNQFAASVVTAGESIPEDGSLTLHKDGVAGEPPGTPHSTGEEFIDDGDNASDIASTYYDMSVGGSVATIDATRPTEEWEVCRDFQSMSLTEQEKREIDQLFKDTMHAFYKAKYRKASDVLECFLPILRKFPSADPFHPDVARVQTTIKTIKARILFEQAQYADAKEVFDDALQHRIEVFGKAHFLCVELYHLIGEWHRSQAQYDAAEKYLNQVMLSTLYYFHLSAVLIVSLSRSCRNVPILGVNECRCADQDAAGRQRRGWQYLRPQAVACEEQDTDRAGGTVQAERSVLQGQPHRAAAEREP